MLSNIRYFSPISSEQSMKNAEKAEKFRVVNTGPKSIPAQRRRMLYSEAILRIEDAIRHRYPLEAIALIESLLSDRLEARLAWINGQHSDKRNFSTPGKLVYELCAQTTNESLDAKAIYKEVKAWADGRNESLHQMVKLAEGDENDWEARLKEAQATAEAGVPLFNKLDALVKKLNKPPKPTA
jgi:hypothetical protein